MKYICTHLWQFLFHFRRWSSTRAWQHPLFAPVNASLSAVPAPGRSGDGGDSLDLNGEQAARAGAAGRGQRLPPRAKTSDDPAFGSRAERFGRPLNEDIPAATAYTPARGAQTRLGSPKCCYPPLALTPHVSL